MIIATAGHFGHGKTALVRALTGTDTDRLPEEKRRGLSIDLGFAYAAMADGRVVGFVDVPGYARFVANMLAGVAAVDLALLVVAADDGVMPQTREHLAILDLLGVSAGAIVITKTDRVTNERVQETTARVRELVRRTSLAEVPAFAVSNVTGEGLQDLKRYLQERAEMRPATRSHGNFRLAVDRCFTLNGVGLVVTGTVFSGMVRTGDTLVVAPSGHAVRVRSLHAQNRAADLSRGGQRVALNLEGASIDEHQIRRGDWVVAAAANHPTDRIDARIRVIDTERAALESLTSVHVHVGTSDVSGRVLLLENEPIVPGRSALVQIVLSRPIIAAHGDRLVLRDQSARRTLAGGSVLDPFASARGRTKTQRLSLLRALELPTAMEILHAALAESRGALDLPWLARALNFTERQAEQLWSQAELIRVGSAPALFGIERSRWQALVSGIEAVLAEWHAQFPEQIGATERDVIRVLPMKVAPAVVAAALSSLVSSRVIRVQAQRYLLPGHRASFKPEQAVLWRRVQPLLAAGDTRPPLAPEIADRLGLSTRPVLAVLERAADLGLVHKVAPTRFFLPESIGKLARVAERLSADNAHGCFPTNAYKDHSGLGRCVSVEVLEFFDRVGLTRRVKSGRKVMRPAAEVFDGGESTPGGAPGLQNR